MADKKHIIEKIVLKYGSLQLSLPFLAAEVPDRITPEQYEALRYAAQALSEAQGQRGRMNKGKRKLPDEKIQEIVKLINKGAGATFIAKTLGVSLMAVHRERRRLIAASPGWNYTSKQTPQF